MRKSFLKIIISGLILFSFWFGLNSIGKTSAYFNDPETSSDNPFAAGVLSFYLSSPEDFSPSVTPTASSSRNISLIDNGTIGFQYSVQTANATGMLCDYLNLTANLDGNQVYNATLTNFIYDAGEFSTSTDDWQFIINLTSNDSSLQNQTCTFDFVFEGWQVGLLPTQGFSYQKEIINLLESGSWMANYLVINEVYYDVASDKGSEPKNEWIELYNPTNQGINVKNWTITDNYATTIIHAEITIPAGGFAVVSKDASTWASGIGYWTLPSGTTKIILGQKIGDGLDNDADMLILKDKEGNIVDQMNWGTPDPNWSNYNLALWDPGPTVAKGHSLARIIKGYDTNQASDWVELTTPNPGTNPHLIAGEESFEEELPIEEELLTEENLEQAELTEELTDELIEEPAEESIEEPISDEVLDETIEEEPATEESIVEEEPLVEEELNIEDTQIAEEESAIEEESIVKEPMEEALIIEETP